MIFGVLKERLQAQIGRAPSDLCYELATASINEGLRLDGMITTDATDVNVWTLPSNFLEISSVYFEHNNQRREIASASPGMFNEGFAQGFHPSHYVISNGALRLNDWTGGVTVEISYYAALPDLAADTDENIVLQNHPSIYVYGVLMHHNALIRDAQAAAGYQQAFAQAMRAAEDVDKRKRFGAFPSAPIVRTAP